MDKKTGVDLKILIPPLARCERCRGGGTEKPMLHEMVCGGCGGAGFVDKESGAALDAGIALVALNQSRRRLLARLRDLSNPPSDPHEPIRNLHGGKYRGD